MKSSIILTDIIYGSFEVEEPFRELIVSAPFQRLKGIHQGGAIFLVDPAQNHTRFNHSLGVYWLVTKFGGSIQERVAALLHDVSHTAFSHVGDYVFDWHNEDYHESVFDQVISQSEIPAILEKYGLKGVLNDFNTYTILEQPLPSLCADRLDYTLRDLYQAGMIGHKQIKSFLNDVAVSEAKLVITTLKAAKWFSKQYARLNEQYFRRPEYLFANYKLAEILRNAIDKGELIAKDLMMMDEDVLSKLTYLGYESELKKISRLDGFNHFEFEKAGEKIKTRKVCFDFFDETNEQ